MYIPYGSECLILVHTTIIYPYFYAFPIGLGDKNMSIGRSQLNLNVASCVVFFTAKWRISCSTNVVRAREKNNYELMPQSAARIASNRPNFRHMPNINNKQLTSHKPMRCRGTKRKKPATTEWIITWYRDKASNAVALRYSRLHNTLYTIYKQLKTGANNIPQRLGAVTQKYTGILCVCWEISEFDAANRPICTWRTEHKLQQANENCAQPIKRCKPKEKSQKQTQFQRKCAHSECQNYYSRRTGRLN